MSHMIRVRKVTVNDQEALQTAVDANPDIHFVAPGTRKTVETIADATGKHTFYSGAAEGIGILLKDWTYPVVVNPKTGEVSYDNFGGSWGHQDEIDRLVQGYCVEKTKMEAMAKNFQMAQEETLDDGSIELTYRVYETH